MSTVVIEFVGGPRDGELLQLRKAPLEYKFPIYRGWQEGVCNTWPELVPPPEAPKVTVGVYRRGHTRAGDPYQYHWQGEREE